MEFNLNALFTQFDVNKNGVVDKAELAEFKKAHPNIPLNGVAEGALIGEIGDQMEFSMKGTSAAPAQPQNQAPAQSQAQSQSPFKTEPFLPPMGMDPSGQMHFPPTTVAESFDAIPQGSHNGVRDARSVDISKLSLTKEQLLNLTIDQTTTMSDEQKAIVQEHMEKMKDPGLGIRNLHAQGITGEGVKIAIIDQGLGEHKEYADNVIHNENINAPTNWGGSMHGSSVASIAVGETTGVAPDADLVYFSTNNMSRDPQAIADYKAKVQEKIANCQNPDDAAFWQGELERVDEKGWVSDNTPYADAINKVLEMNKKLPDGEKIPVISISWGFDEFGAGYDKLLKALEDAKKSGVFVINTAMSRLTYGEEGETIMPLGANRDPQLDPNDPNSYEAGAFYKKRMESDELGMTAEEKERLLLIPMDHRTTANFWDSEGYRYEGNDGGQSWTMPWFAGMYALAKQADPNITPEAFYQYALETSNECYNNTENVDGGHTYAGRIINPEALISRIKEAKGE